MTDVATTCESCGMPLPTGADHALGDPSIPYCQQCTDESGALADFDTRFARMVQWAIRKEGLDREAAEARTRDYMRSMPAWRDHPRLQTS
jgi:hypothetical protein